MLIDEYPGRAGSLFVDVDDGVIDDFAIPGAVETNAVEVIDDDLGTVIVDITLIVENVDPVVTAPPQFTGLEGSLRVPFIMRWPGKVPEGAVSNEIVHALDLFVTFAEMAGGKATIGELSKFVLTLSKPPNFCLFIFTNVLK